MALADSNQANDFPGDASLHPIPYQPHNQAPQNTWIPPAPDNGQPEDHWEDIPHGVAGRIRDPHHFDEAYQGNVDHRPQPLIGNPGYVFPDVGLPQGIPAQVRPNAPVNPFGYAPQHNALGPVPAAFPHPFVHRIPTPNQAGAENLRRIASRYLHHPDAQVGMVSMEAGAAGRFKVVIILESNDVF